MWPFSDSPIKSIISIQFTFQRCWITKLHCWGLKRIIFNLCHVKIVRERERGVAIGSNSCKDSSVRLARPAAWKKEKKTMQVSLFRAAFSAKFGRALWGSLKAEGERKRRLGGRGEERDSCSERICRRASYFRRERTAHTRARPSYPLSSCISIIVPRREILPRANETVFLLLSPLPRSRRSSSCFFYFPALFARRARIRFPDRFIAARGKRAGRLANDFQSPP